MKAIMTLVVLILLLSCGDSNHNLALKDAIYAPIKVSHRGYDENSIKGFKQAAKDGFTHLETDVRLRNNKLVLLHDDKECIKCNNLEELLLFAEQEGLTLWIEFKEIESVKPGVELVSKYNVDVILMSFDIDAVKLIAEVSNHKIGWITYNTDKLADVEKIIDWLVIEKSKTSLCVNYVKCAAWTIKSKEEELLLNVDALITDLKHSE